VCSKQLPRKKLMCVCGTECVHVCQCSVLRLWKMLWATENVVKDVLLGVVKSQGNRIFF
jgi:hypothetical protein